MINKKEMIEDIKYLREILGGEYLVNTDWLVNDAYEGLVTGELSIEDFLRDAITDIFCEVQCEEEQVDKKTKEEFYNDSEVISIAEKYSINFVE